MRPSSSKVLSLFMVCCSGFQRLPFLTLTSPHSSDVFPYFQCHPCLFLFIIEFYYGWKSCDWSYENLRVGLLSTLKVEKIFWLDLAGYLGGLGILKFFPYKWLVIVFQEFIPYTTYPTVLRGSCGMLRIKPRLAARKANTLPAIVAVWPCSNLTFYLLLLH